MGLTADDFEAASPNFSNIKVELVEDGKLIITPAKERPVPQAAGYEGEYDGQTHTVTLTEDGRIAGDEIIFTYVDPADQTKTIEASEAPSAKNVADSIGFVTVTIKNKNYEDVILDPVPLNIFKKQVEVITPSASKPYDGTPLTAEGSVDGLVAGETVDFTTTGKVTLPSEGEVTNTYKLEWTGADEANYQLTEDLGTLKITDRPDGEKFVIYATPLNAGTVVYDGKEKTDFDYTLSWEVTSSEAKIEDGGMKSADANIFTKAARAIGDAVGTIVDFVTDIFTIKSDAKEKADTYSDGSRTFTANVNAEVKADRTAKDVGNYTLSMDEATLGNFTVTDGNGNDVTSQFVVKAKGTGSLEITPAPVTVTAENKSKASGAKDPELTAKTEPENPELYAEAIQTVKYSLGRKKGESAGKYPITPAGDEIQGNFKVTYVPGELVITGGGGGTPVPDPTPGGPTEIPDDPTPTAPAPPAPAGTVLGARRDEVMTDGAAVLGARRGRTEDETNQTARVMAILISAAAALALILAGRRKEEEEK